MIRVPHAATALLSLVILSACGGDTGSPTGPGPIRSGNEVPPPPAPAPPAPAPPAGQPPTAVRGTIALISVSPDSGNSLTVATCSRGGPPRECASDWRGTFEVTLDGPVEFPILVARFYDGETLCGYAAGGFDSVIPAGATLFHPSTIYLTDEFGTLSPPCALPAKVTRMVVEVWTEADGTFSVKQEFPISYTFIKP